MLHCRPPLLTSWPGSWSCCRSNFLNSLFDSASFTSSLNFGEDDSLKPLTTSSQVWQTMKISGKKLYPYNLKKHLYFFKQFNFLVLISRLKLTLGRSFAILGETLERRLIDNTFSFRLWYDVHGGLSLMTSQKSKYDFHKPVNQFFPTFFNSRNL